MKKASEPEPLPHLWSDGNVRCVTCRLPKNVYDVVIGYQADLVTVCPGVNASMLTQQDIGDILIKAGYAARRLATGW